MDPLSISTSAGTLIGAVVKTSATVTKFAQSIHDAHQELSATSQELDNLHTVLELLQHGYNDETMSTHLPTVSSMAMQIHSVLRNCNNIMNDLDQFITKYNSKQVQWMLFGKDKVIAINTQIATHTKILQITLGVSTL